MGETSETHVVEIPMDSETNQLTLIAEENHEEDRSSPMQHHPLTEISESPGHLLLLKLYQREEDHIAHRINLKETRLDSLKREAFYLSSLFFSFHGLFLTLVFTASISQVGKRACRSWWVPCCLSMLTSVVLISSIQVKVWGYWKVLRGLNRERGDSRAVRRLVQELRMKGSRFDLSTEAPMSKRAKTSSSVEVKWRRPFRVLKQNVVTICLVAFTGLVVPACKFILCS